MCGIYGTFLFEGKLSLAQAIQALDKLKHRGPDGFGFEYGSISHQQYELYHNRLPDDSLSQHGEYFLGHRRLSIIDLNDNAFQPMESTDRRYSITFNGEIYNHIELREELLAEGCSFVTDHSDTEVLLNAYATWGDDCLEKLRGMFGFAIYDRQKQIVFIARDRIGQKSIYYEINDHHFTFASELPPISHFCGPRPLNITALNLYMALGYVPHPDTLFEGVQKLPPATYAKVDLKTKKITLHEYWDIRVAIDADRSFDEVLETTKASIAESVQYRLRADVTVGAFISGGIDSTIIVKYITETGNRKLDIYGADFPNTDRSEKKYIIEAAKKYDQQLNLCEIDMAHVANIDSIIKVFDEPFDGASSIALFDLFKAASTQHKVILTGDGGDEMFAGYSRYMDFPKQDRFINLLRNMLFPKVFLNLLEKFGIRNSKLASLKRMLEGNLIENFNGINGDTDLSQVLKPEHRVKRISDTRFFSELMEKIKRKKLSPIKALQYLEIKTILPGRMLYKLDRFSMFYGVEARSPLLDHKLVEKAFTIPDKMNIQNGIAKNVLKSILLEDFEYSFVHREKQGFGNPLSNWFRNSQPTDIFNILQNKNSLVFKYLDYDATHRFFPELKAGYQGKREKELWRLLVVAHYLKNNANLLY